MAVIATSWPTMKNTDEPYFKALGARLAQARKAQHRTQQQLADQIGLAQQTYAHYEGARQRVPAFMLAPLARVLGLTLEELLGEEAKPQAKRGPTSRLDQQFECIRQLPRTKQAYVMEVLDAVIDQASRKANA